MSRSALVLCLLAAVCAAVTPDNDDRIVGGEPVDISQFPWQVSLEAHKDGSPIHYCGGSIIGSTWVLTAVHCTYGITPQDVYVRAGTSFRERGGYVYDVTRIIAHEDHDDVTMDYDIALLEISEPVSFGSCVQAVLLGSAELAAGTEVTLAGWGRTSSTGSQPEQLRAVTTTVVDRDSCKAAYARRYTVTERNICAGEEGGKGSCVGDSGGAVVAGSTQYGIVSWATGCAFRGYPTVSTNVPALRLWIKEKSGI